MSFAGREVRIGKNYAQEQGHSFSQYGPLRCFRKKYYALCNASMRKTCILIILHCWCYPISYCSRLVFSQLVEGIKQKRKQRDRPLKFAAFHNFSPLQTMLFTKVFFLGKKLLNAFKSSLDLYSLIILSFE